MLNRVSRWLFNRNRRLFEDWVLEDLIGHIPVSVNEPASDFLANSGVKLQPWLMWQSNIIQRKAIAEPQHSEIFRGMMLEIKIILLMAGRKNSPMKKVAEKEVEAEKDYSKGVDDFINGFKKK